MEAPAATRRPRPSAIQLRLLRAVAEGQVARDDRGWHVAGVPVDHELAVLARAGVVRLEQDVAALVPTTALAARRQVTTVATPRPEGLPDALPV